MLISYAKCFDFNGLNHNHFFHLNTPIIIATEESINPMANK